MGLRIHRRIKIFPGVILNIHKTGISFSFGRPGARITVGPRGIRKTIGIPGTGVYYTTTDSIKKILEKIKTNKQ